MLESDDIKRLCAEVRRFSKMGDLLWKGLPIVAWEFADMAHFHGARAKILHALSPDMIHAGNSQLERMMGPDCLEIDCHGVTFRLICKQKTMTRHGPYGAAEMR